MYVKNRFADTGAVGNAVRFDPTHPVRSTANPFASELGGFWQWINTVGTTTSINKNAPANPVSMLELRDDRSKAWDLLGNIDIDYKLHFFPDLRYHLNLASNISHGEQNTVISPNHSNLY